MEAAGQRAKARYELPKASLWRPGLGWIGSVIVKAEFRARHGKRLAREACRQHINGFKIVGNHRQILNGFMKEGCLREIVAVGLNRETVSLISPGNFESFLCEGYAEAA